MSVNRQNKRGRIEEINEGCDAIEKSKRSKGGRRGGEIRGIPQRKGKKERRRKRQSDPEKEEEKGRGAAYVWKEMDQVQRVTDDRKKWLVEQEEISPQKMSKKDLKERR